MLKFKFILQDNLTALKLLSRFNSELAIHFSYYHTRSKPTVGKLQLASHMRLLDINFVALVLNCNITKKIEIILYQYVILRLKLFSFIDVLQSDKTSICFHSADDKLQYNYFKESR